MKKFIRIGVDLAKNYFQIHALTSESGPAVTRKLRRAKMLAVIRLVQVKRNSAMNLGNIASWHIFLRKDYKTCRYLEIGTILSLTGPQIQSFSFAVR